VTFSAPDNPHGLCPAPAQLCSRCSERIEAADTRLGPFRYFYADGAMTLVDCGLDMADRDLSGRVPRRQPRRAVRLPPPVLAASAVRGCRLGWVLLRNSQYRVDALSREYPDAKVIWSTVTLPWPSLRRQRTYTTSKPSREGRPDSSDPYGRLLAPRFADTAPVAGARDGRGGHTAPFSVATHLRPGWRSQRQAVLRHRQLVEGPFEGEGRCLVGPAVGPSVCVDPFLIRLHGILLAEGFPLQRRLRPLLLSPTWATAPRSLL
jgi:hypothetical protein